MNYPRKSTRAGATELVMWSTGNCVSDSNLNIQTNLNQSLKITEKIICDFHIQTGTPIATTWPKLDVGNQKKCMYQIVAYTIPEDYWVKINASEKLDKYLYLVRHVQMNPEEHERLRSLENPRKNWDVSTIEIN